MVVLTLVVTACGSTTDNKDLVKKKEKLEELKKDQAAVNADIKALELEIASIDTSAKKEDAKLVALDTLSSAGFTHYIELQGKVDASNISYVAPRGGGGQVAAVYVKEGQYVKKGQLLLKLDDAIVKQNVATARQSVAAIKNQLDLAKNLLDRTKNLWDQHIGTEVQLLQAKTNVEVLENQLKT